MCYQYGYSENNYNCTDYKSSVTKNVTGYNNMIYN